MSYCTAFTGLLMQRASSTQSSTFLNLFFFTAFLASLLSRCGPGRLPRDCLLVTLISPYIYWPWGPLAIKLDVGQRRVSYRKRSAKRRNARLNYYSAHGLAGAPATSLMLTHRWRQRHLLIELIRRPTNRKR